MQYNQFLKRLYSLMDLKMKGLNVTVERAHDRIYIHLNDADVNEVEKRFKKDIEPDVYRVYIYRFWQALCRVLCSQEIMHATDNNIK